MGTQTALWRLAGGAARGETSAGLAGEVGQGGEMKQLSKEQWRKIYGMREPKDPADPNVIARRALHVSITKWELKWVTRLHLISVFLAFAIVLLPALNKTWYGLIASIPIFQWIHRAFSNFSGVFFLSLAAGLFIHSYSHRKLDGKNYSEYGYPINLSGVRSTKNIAQGDLYPRTRLEENIFYVDCAGGIWAATVFWFIAFGLISIYIKSY